ncbi:type II toxin-antitoxin system VapC family toxin [Alysiella filiformis]|uniref:PIN domain nuclease, a component of toxin-antitoxin system (PIN domain) n=1 Tax=Alysiella filiformis DSM 16848 TaxID=1120981 RepID=A0A286E336_9NEIS|nr:type II toxin-antitoxin system VapC family toxin [Alysiella filiformis]QMT31143.1 type II toxin-antitoxin system VapC family toxin [Alysiella filiformis]UBQ55865.1 type II toxin-antitoxin system VapC family toxin [Alysiella filiformis DSM 16848]SOD65307.1 PIN domain nuclease, a component of toxin-antitoxin system (PIN domain) [Alysiella filiformis DSM 16848]
MKQNKYLLDTHVLLWLADNRKEKFSSEIIAVLENRQQNQFFVSAVSIWEITLKAALNKPDFPYQAEEMLKNMQKVGIHLLDIHINHILMLNHVPLIHKDPFDRLLIAQAHSEKLNLLTADTAILQYPSDLIVDIRP